MFTAALLTASLSDLGYEAPKFDSNLDLLVTPVDFLGEGGSASVRIGFSVLIPRNFGRHSRAIIHLKQSVENISVNIDGGFIRCISLMCVESPAVRLQVAML